MFAIKCENIFLNGGDDFLT